MLDQPIVSAGFTGPVVLSGNGKMMASLQALGQFYSNIDVYELNKDEEWSLSQSIDVDQGYGIAQPAFSDDGSRLVVVDEVSVTVAGNKRFVCRARVLARDAKYGNKYIPLGENVVGYQDEYHHIGDVAISADGGTVALVATTSTTVLSDMVVRIHRWNPTAKNWDMIGNIGMKSLSEIEVSLTANGNRIAIQSVGSDPRGPRGRRGRVSIMDFDEDTRTWSAAATTPLERTGVVFHRVSISDDGTRVMVLQEGVVPEQTLKLLALDLDPQTKEWNGRAVVDLKHGIPRNMRMSGDGTTVIIGAPFLDDAELTEVFRIQSGGNWERVGQSLTDGGKDGKYGLSVSLSRDGNTIASTGGSFAFGTAGEAKTKVYSYQFESATEC